jgi:DNA-binding transcriptional LysR family regulator
VPRDIPPADAHDVTLIVPGRESSTRAVTERLLGRARYRPARVLELDSVEAVKRAVRSGAGVALLSRLAVVDELAAGDLREIMFLGGPGAVRTIEILRTEHRHPMPLEQAFEQALRLHCADTQRPTSRHEQAAVHG